MESWIVFWKWAYLIGLAAFFCLAVAVIPLGARDLVALFRHLSAGDQQADDEQEVATQSDRPDATG